MIAKYTLYNSEDYISQNALDRLETDRIDLKKNTIEVIFMVKKSPTCMSTRFQQQLFDLN